ncbi:Oxoglutarate 3-dioxygenase [Mycena chlorophos]|uniref:Oxoglutarate 3-dioxygenase n=1 Tax=Mycena chlorophos TaxID=658473 RepID=A0A8H6RY74_MYCCL|nr:Oxoglutarate 3-dioxygenase [Mycena chlorophos]
MTSNLQLPIIDMAPYLTPAATPEQVAARKAVSGALHDACLRFGFFYLDISTYVDPLVPDELAALARDFFHLPQEVKDRISLTKQDNARGPSLSQASLRVQPTRFTYLQDTSASKRTLRTERRADNHEGLDFYRPVEQPDRARPLWGENQYPPDSDVPGFRAKYELWVEKMKILGLIERFCSSIWHVIDALVMAIGLGLTSEEWQELRAQVDDSFWVMRAIGYPPLPDDHDGFSCGAHKDYGCLTFLYADPTPSALQVFLQQPGAVADAAPLAGLPVEQWDAEGVWINADPIPGCVVCNIGEMWEIWSAGLYKSTLHRVIHRSSNYRVSIPFFFEPNFDAMIKPLAAAKRIRGDTAPEPEPVSYGEISLSNLICSLTRSTGAFLMKKVGNNFTTGKGKYDS